MPWRKGKRGSAKEKKAAPKARVMVYVRENIGPLFAKFREDHPFIGKSDIMNAALEFYLQYACHGVDNHMRPHAAPNLATGRKEVWGEEKREAYRMILEEAQRYAEREGAP